MIVGALVVVVAFWAGVAVIIGGFLVPGWLGGAALLSGVVAARLSARFLSARSGGPVGSSALGAPQSAAVWLAGMGTVLSLCIHVIYGAAFMTLQPAAPGGCVLIAEETSFLFAGSGAVWFAPASWGLARQVMDYHSDDGRRPFSTGGYELSWLVGGTSLTVRDGVDPVWFGETEGDTAC